MWFKTTSRDHLYGRLTEFNKEQHGDYWRHGEFQGPGWYWLEVRNTYFRMGAYDNITFAIPAAERIAEIKEKMQALANELREARNTTRE